MSQAWLCRTLASGKAGVAPSDGLDAVMEVARHHRVDVILADLILRTPRDLESSSPLHRQAFEDIVRLAAARELPAAHDLSRLFERAHRHGVALLVLKGAALAYTHYRRPYLRPRNDIDLFLRRADLGQAEEILRALDFERAVEADAELWTGQRHYVRNTPTGAVFVDLHWKVANARAFADALTFEDAWLRSVAVPALGQFARTLSAPDALLLACVHRVAHHQDRANLLWLWDIHLLASGLSAAEWEVFIDRSTRARMRLVCARGLTLAHECFDTAVPDTASEALEAPSDEPAAAFLRGGLRQIDVARADLATLTTWRQRFALVREHLFPPPAYMRTKYPRCPAVLLPFAYLHRIARGAPKWFER
jgi:hypothetical protein